jgi:hypothetical protein
VTRTPSAFGKHQVAGGSGWTAPGVVCALRREGNLGMIPPGYRRCANRDGQVILRCGCDSCHSVCVGPDQGYGRRCMVAPRRPPESVPVVAHLVAQRSGRGAGLPLLSADSRRLSLPPSSQNRTCNLRGPPWRCPGRCDQVAQAGFELHTAPEAVAAHKPAAALTWRLFIAGRGWRVSALAILSRNTVEGLPLGPRPAESQANKTGLANVQPLAVTGVRPSGVAPARDSIGCSL